MSATHRVAVLITFHMAWRMNIHWSAVTLKWCYSTLAIPPSTAAGVDVNDNKLTTIALIVQLMALLTDALSSNAIRTSIILAIRKYLQRGNAAQYPVCMDTVQQNRKYCVPWWYIERLIFCPWNPFIACRDMNFIWPSYLSGV